jgi:mucin-2
VRELWAAWKAGAAALRGPLVVLAIIVSFVLGGAAASSDAPTPTPSPRRVSTVALDRLTAALDRNTAHRHGPAPSVAVTASSVLDSVERGETVVIPPPTTAAPIAPSTTTSTPPTTTTTTVPPTTVPDDVIRFEPHVPTSWVPPPDSVVAP